MKKVPVVSCVALSLLWLLAGEGLAVFNRTAYENSQGDGIGVLEVVAGAEAPEGRPRLFVPLRRTELRGEVAGPLASLRLVQVYGYSRQQSEKVIEALYRFPLPGDAAVVGVRVRFGEVVIRTELKERQRAEVEYEEAKREGRQAALVTRESPDVFTLKVAGIRPDQDVVVETSYVQLARAEGAGWSLRVPLTTAPRYVRSDEVTSRHARGQPLGVLRDPGHRFSMDLTLRGTGAVESSTHRLDVKTVGDGARVRLREGEVLPDRDCVLSWRPAQAQDRPALQVILHDDPGSEYLYFMALVAPPAVHDPERTVPQEAVLLVDHSGSMEGDKWKAADRAVTRFLSGLRGRDAFAMGLFHNTTRWFSEAPVPAEAGAVQAGIRFLLEHRDSGGTELGVALEQALSLDRAAGGRTRHVLVITDAEVSDAGRILRLASEESRRADRRRISVLCIDAAPNSFLTSELAERGGGVARFLTSDPEEGDLSKALDEVLADWTSPVLADLRLEVDRAGVQASGHEVFKGTREGWSSVDLGDLPSGRTVWVAGRAPRGEAEKLTFRVAAEGEPEVAVYRADLSGGRVDRPALKALFGARRVLGLEFLIESGYRGDVLEEQLARLGYDPKEALADRPEAPERVYAENVRADAKKALRGLLVKEALHYGLACSETAFVGVRTEKGKPVEATVAVANALPAGWEMRGGAGGPSALMKSTAGARSAGMRMQRMMAYAPSAPAMEMDEEAQMPVGADRPAMDRPSYTWLQGYDESETIAGRIPVPDGYKRVDAAPGSFEAWLRRLPLKKGSPPVRLYDGSLKPNQGAHDAVVEIDVGDRDLQQCADAVIRLRAEYLYSRGDYDAIHFNFTSGDTAKFRDWIEGYRPKVAGNNVTWVQRAKPDSSHASFRRYLDTVFTYAGSYSLSKELRKTEADRMGIGDVFIQGGFPGHAVLVVDMAVDPQTGSRLFLLAQSYMAAQDVHILKNPDDAALSPWYRLDFGETLRTPEWTFGRGDLKRFFR